MLDAFLPSRELVHENGCWQSSNSVKYTVLLSNTSLHLQTSLQDWTYSYGNTSEETTQDKMQRQNSLLSTVFQLCHFVTLEDYFLPDFHKLTRKTHRF